MSRRCRLCPEVSSDERNGHEDGSNRDERLGDIPFAPAVV
jgi:hypothetical protein